MSQRTTISIPKPTHKRLKLLSVHEEKELGEVADQALQLGLALLEKDPRTTSATKPHAKAA
jgi:hypothetical protein